MSLASSTISTMNEGKQLRDLLREHEKTPSALARAAQVTPTAVSKWMDSERISDRTWPLVRKGLHALGIPSAVIRPEDTRRVIDASELERLLEGFDRDQLERVRKIMELDPQSQGRVLGYIIGALAVSRK